MKALIEHLLHENKAEILSKSLLNCHIKGLHSIMLSECPEKTIRLYIAEHGNELHLNSFNHFKNGEMSVGFHPHHCNITISVIKGNLFNFIVEESENGTLSVDKYLYNSEITKAKIGFSLYEKNVALSRIADFCIPFGKSCYMNATEIHTVYCDPNEVTAWLVFEGKENPNYEPFTYAPINLEAADFSGLYQKPTMDVILGLLKNVDLI